MGDGALSGAITGAVTGGLSRSIQVVRNVKVTNARSLTNTGRRFSSQSLVKNGNVTTS